MLLSTGEQVSVALMAMAIHSLGHKAVSLTGAQIGIKTDSTHTKARIQSISTDRIQRLLNEGNIVIAAGFQGIDEDFNITTLGRGGSDTTAVALAAVLNADACEIYTDVDGVYTTDPRMLPEAGTWSRSAYDEMLELASLGAGVMHNRSIEFAKKFGVPIHVRSSFSDTPGTMIVAEPEVAGPRRVRRRGDEERSTGDRAGGPGRAGRQPADLLARSRPEHRGRHDRAERRRERTRPTSRSPCRKRTAATLESSRGRNQLGSGRVSTTTTSSKVSVVGLGMAKQTGVAQQCSCLGRRTSTSR